MLSEEALILYTFFIGLGLLALGIWETIAPSRPRKPQRPAVPGHQDRGESRSRSRDGWPRPPRQP